LSPRRRPICGRQQRPSVRDRQLRLRWTDIAASDPGYRRLPHRNLREACPFATATNEPTPSRLGDRRLSGRKIVDGNELTPAEYLMNACCVSGDKWRGPLKRMHVTFWHRGNTSTASTGTFSNLVTC